MACGLNKRVKDANARQSCRNEHVRTEAVHCGHRVLIGWRLRARPMVGLMVVLIVRLLLPSMMSAQQTDASQASPPSLASFINLPFPSDMIVLRNIQPLTTATSGSAPASEPKPFRSGALEVGARYSTMSAGYPPASEIFLHAETQQSSITRWSVDVSRPQEFGDSGYLIVGGLTRDFTDRWYGDFHMGGSNRGFFLPAFTGEGTLHKTWLAQKTLVTSFGVGYDRAKDEHRDTRLLASARYFFEHPWMLEGGLTFNLSAPGTVFSHSQYLAIRQGHDGRHFVTARGEFGSEAYQIIGPETSITGFNSRSVSLLWQQWIHATWGFNLGVEYYSNRYYQRLGPQVGIFKQF
jgi:YaiO family outer membrane protein